VGLIVVNYYELRILSIGAPGARISNRRTFIDRFNLLIVRYNYTCISYLIYFVGRSRTVKTSRKLRIVVFGAILAGMIACSHGGTRLSREDSERVFDATKLELDFSVSEVNFRRQVDEFKKIINKRDLEEKDFFEIERFYAFYRAALGLSNSQKLSIPSASKIKISLPSFCLDPTKVVPSDHEVFKWTRKDTKIPYYIEIIRMVSDSSTYRQEDVQELIWNLRNEARLEDYPSRLRMILERIDPNAKFVLPSRSRNAVIDAAERAIRDRILTIDVAEEAFSLLQGRYYTYKEFASQLRPKASTPPSEKSEIVPLQGIASVYASVQSFGFSKQQVVLYNASPIVGVLDFSQYHLQPLDDDAQRIGIYAEAQLGRRFISIIEDALRDTVIRNSAYWYKGRLTPAEAAFIRAYPLDALNAYAQSRRAILSTWKYFGRNVEDDESDAFRHFIWAGLLSEQLGEARVREYLSAHEDIPANAAKAGSSGLEMDRYNNEEGLRAARALADKNELSLARLENEARNAIAQDKLNVLRSRGKTTIYPVSGQVYK